MIRAPPGAAETKPVVVIGRSAYRVVRARSSAASGAVYRPSAGGAGIAGQASGRRRLRRQLP
ncbi:MAG: hypothetical protein ACRDM9_13465, partial [Gaiellaceae bacterium]